MKAIQAIIQRHMLTKVMDALHAFPHFPGITLSDCVGQGRGCGSGGHYVATEETIGVAKMVKLGMLCSDANCDELLRVIAQTAHTDNPGDGIVMVADVPPVVRIRTGQEQDEAV